MHAPGVCMLIDTEHKDAAAFVQLPVGKSICLFDSRPESRKQLTHRTDHGLVVLDNKHAIAVALLAFRKPVVNLAKFITSREFIADVKSRASETGSAVACEVDNFIRNPPVTAVKLTWRTAMFGVRTVLAVPKAAARLFHRNPQPKPYISIGPEGGVKPSAAKKPTPAAALPQPPTKQPAGPAGTQQLPPVLQQLAAMGFHPPGAAPPRAAAPAAPAAPAAASTAPASSGAASAAKGLGMGLGGGLPSRSKPTTAAAPPPPQVEDVEEDDEWEEADEEDMEQM